MDGSELKLSIEIVKERQELTRSSSYFFYYFLLIIILKS
jgi:hypothetical protein